MLRRRRARTTRRASASRGSRRTCRALPTARRRSRSCGRWTATWRPCASRWASASWWGSRGPHFFSFFSPLCFFQPIARGYQRTLFSVCAEKTTLISPPPQRPLPVTQATRGIACPKPSEEPQVSTFAPRGGLCALRRHLLAGQVVFESKNLTANPFKTSFERRIEALF
jgi:hypothetical protein